MTAAQAYLHSWDAIGEMLKQGRSWSGSERNCCLINMQDGSFVDISSIAGLDHRIDSRAVAVTDWDHDGDLDLWYSNRMSPRLRLMQNQLENANFLQLKLTGTKSNRDAIGARAEVHLDEAGTNPIVRVVTAGSGYLSQSSKWLHFGLGDSERVAKLIVYWPSGEIQEFNGLNGNRRYHITQGLSPQSTTRTVRRTPATSSQTQDADPPIPMRRIVPHGPIPFPEVTCQPEGRSETPMRMDTGQSTLLVLWASWCPTCITELQELGDEREMLSALGLRVVPLNCDDLSVDAPKENANVDRLLRSFGFDREGGRLNPDSLKILNAVRSTILKTRESIVVPMSLLIDGQGRLVAIYEGATSIVQLKKDVARLISKRHQTNRDLAVPFAGRWYVNPMPTDLLEMVDRLLEMKMHTTAFAYLERHARPIFLRKGIDFYLPAERMVASYLRVGIGLAESQQTQLAESALQFVLHLQPKHWAGRAALASLYSQTGRLQATLEQFEVMLRQRPNDIMILNNVAWILSTSANASLRDPQRGLKMAEILASKTQNKNASALDTLAAALAANNRFKDAVATAERAIQLSIEREDQDLAERIRKRKEIYARGNSFVE